MKYKLTEIKTKTECNVKYNANIAQRNRLKTHDVVTGVFTRLSVNVPNEAGAYCQQTIHCQSFPSSLYTQDTEVFGFFK